MIKALAEKYKKSAGQILLKFQVQRNIATIPKSVTASRIQANIDIFDFEISDDDMNALLEMNGPHRAYNFDRTAKIEPPVKYGPHFVFKIW